MRQRVFSKALRGSWAVALVMFSSCGDFLTGEKTHRSKQGSEDARAVADESASLEFSLNSFALQESEVLELILIMVTGDTSTVRGETYGRDKTKVSLKRLVPGLYKLELRLKNKTTGKVLFVGSDEIQLKAGQTAEAKIKMVPFQDTRTGSIEVSIEYPDVPVVPGNCTKEAKVPVCVKVGDTYKVQKFEKDAQCRWVPNQDTLQVVEKKFCKDQPDFSWLL